MLQIPLALRHRSFAIFWVGTLLAWIGNQVMVWAIPWHIRTFTQVPFAFGAIGLIRLFPTLLLSLFAGLAADSFSRRKVVFMTQSLMVVIALSFGLLSWTGTIRLWHIYLLLGAHATVYVFDLPARYAMTPNLVPKRDLPNALSVEFLGIQMGSLLGPVFSGILLERYGQSAAYLASACLISCMLLVLLLLGSIPQRKIKAIKSGIDWGSIKEGAGFTFHHPLIFPGMLLDFMATLLTRADSLMPYFARDILGLNAIQYGWLSASSAMGAVLAGITLSQLRVLRHQGKTLLLAVGMVGVGAVIFGSSRSFPLSMAALIMVGASDSLSSIIRSTIRQQHTPDNLRGRMTSVNQIFFSGGPYLGDVKSGFIGGLIGVPLAVALGGVLCIGTTGWIARRWSGLRTYAGALEEN
jgi:MFS family permease